MNAPALLTSTEENYLKAVFALAQPRIGTNALADRVQTKASSATDTSATAAWGSRPAAAWPRPL